MLKDEGLQYDYNLDYKEVLYLVPVGDMHIGSPECNHKYLKYWSDVISRIKAPKRVYLMGDLIEMGTKKLANSSFQQCMRPGKQIKFAKKLLKPFAEDIVFGAIGNHEERLIKDYDFDIMEGIADDLGIPWGYQYKDSFMVNGEKKIIYLQHGAGSTKWHYTAESKHIRDTQHVNADILFQGHNHRCGAFRIPHMVANFNRNGIDMDIKPIWYCMTGGFLKYGGYAKAKQLPPLPESFIHIKINENHRIIPEPFYIDERVPELLEPLGVHSV